MRLKHVETVDFRRSELTNYNILVSKQPSLRALGKQDAILLRNAEGNQLVFLMGVYSTRVGGEGDTRYIRSEKLRLLGSTRWNSLMIGDYARQCGIRLENSMLFEDHLDELKRMVDKAAEAAKKAVLKGLRRRAA